MQQRDELRSIILETARDLFVREGFETFSMRKLAGAVGYSPAAIYKHFTSKEEIFKELIEVSFQALSESQAAAALEPESDPLAALERGLRSYVRFGLENPHIYRFAFLVPSTTDRTPASRQSFDALRSRVRNCMAAGLFPAVDLELACQTLWTAVHGVTSLLIVRPNFPWVDREALFDQVIRGAIRGLSA